MFEAFVTRARRVLIGAIALLAAGCVTPHESTLAQYQGRVLSVASEDGATRLDIETSYDSGIRGFMDQAGRPAYLYVRSAREVAFFYLDEPRTVLFRRGPFGSRSVPSIEPGISLQVAQYFSAEDRRRAIDAQDAEAIEQEPQDP